MKGYEGYKESGIPWDICEPATWDCVRGKALFDNPKYINKNNEYKNVLSLTLKEVIRNNIENPNGLVPKSYDTYQLFEKDDLVFKLIDLENISTSRVGLVGEQGIMSPAYIRLVLRKKEKQNIKYYYYQYFSLYQRQIFNSLGAGVRQTLSARELLEQKIMVPPKPEQDKIVQFLDWKTSEMNRFIHQKKKQIKLLEELKYTQIDQYITKGLNPSVSMKDSKVEWIGEIPEHWEVIPAKRLFLEKKETRYESDEPCTASQKYGIISQKEYMLRENSRVVIAEQGLESWKHVSKDDFVISLRSFQGGIERSEVEGCVTWHYIVLRPNKEVNPNYYKWLLKSKSYITALQTTSEFIRDGQDLRYSNFIKVPLLKIPYREQQEIAEYLEELSIKINEMISGINREITLVEELRTKLISDAVTGQVDVRDVKIPIYEEETDIIDSEDDSDEENPDESMEEQEDADGKEYCVSWK